ncbi:MAG TPA: isoprenylcysteine carboxylmethyltransferase family protein [Acidobacteriaceae bacterium]
MKATPLEFRFRYIIHAVIYLLGFTTPWNYWLHIDPTGFQSHSWGILASKLGSGTLAWFNVLLLFAILMASLGAFLRTWGAAYLGAGIVQSHDMHGDSVLADGPYRHFRNPLYLGTFLHTFALALLMPPSGSLFAIVFIGLFQLRLIFAEEPFLAARLGQPYLDYCKRVPCILPTLTPRVPPSGAHPRWLQGILGEIYMIGVALSFAVFGWRYDAFFLTKCVVISLGVSLVVRAIAPRTAPQTMSS